MAGDDVNEHDALRQVLEEKCPVAIRILKDDDISKLEAAGYFTIDALAEATKEDLLAVLPGRPGVVGLFLKAFVQPAGKPPLNKSKSSLKAAEALRQVLGEKYPDSGVEDDDIIKLVAAGFSTPAALAAATMERLDAVLPGRHGVVGLLLKAFVQPAGPGKDQRLTRQQWLKQELPRLKLAFSHPPGLRNEKIEYYPESVKMWENFREDVVDYVATLASSDEGPFYSSGDFVHVEYYKGYNEESVKSVYEIILTALLGFHEFENPEILPTQNFSTSSLRAHRELRRANLSPASARAMDNADVDDHRRFIPDAILKPGSKFFLVVEYKKTSFFRQSTETPLPDLVSAYADYSQHGGNAKLRSLTLVEAIRKVYKYMVKLSLGYAVISSADASYFVRHVDGADPTYQNCMEISEGYSWASKDSTMLEAFSYVMDRAAKDQKKYEFRNAAEPVTVMQESEEDQKSQDPDVKVKVTKRPKINHVSETQNDDLQEVAAADLHLEAYPFATGWSGNVVGGRISCHRVAVKLAPILSVCAEALINEARVYNRLKQYWGQYIPKLISHGTTVNGQVVYIAIELVNGFAIGIEPLTEAVAAAAFEALNAVHASGTLHGDIREDNILVAEGSVQLIDFGFSMDSTSNEDHKKELEQLLDIISQIWSRVRRNGRPTGNDKEFSLFPDFTKALSSMGVSLSHAY